MQTEPNKHSAEYYRQGIKFVEFCQTLIFQDGSPIDINQKYVIETLFDTEVYKRVLFDFKVENERIKVKIKSWIELESLEKSEPELFEFVERVVGLFSSLCHDRNFISKKYISRLFASGVLVNYLQLPISSRLKNIFFMLISNIYVDSFPRVERPKPVSVLLFTETYDQLSKPASFD